MNDTTENKSAPGVRPLPAARSSHKHTAGTPGTGALYKNDGGGAVENMHINMTGFKGLSKDIALAPLNLVVGPNGSGKSALADAIRFSALGYVPALGKRPADTAVLMSGDYMAVTVRAGGRTWTRSLTRDGKTLKTSADLAGCEGTATRHGEEIQQLFGASEQDVAESLDIRQLLAAPPAQRAARLEAMLATARGNAVDAVARLTVMRLIDAPEDRMPKDWRDAAPMLADSHRAALGELGPICAAKVESGLTQAQEWANKGKRGADVRLRERAAAENELRTRMASMPAPDPERLRARTADRDRLREELGAARERHSAWSAKRSRATEIEADLVRAGEAVADANRAVDAIGAGTAPADAMRQELANIQKALDAQKAPEAPACDFETTVEINKLRERLPQVPDYPAAERRIMYGRKRLEVLEQDLADVADSPWTEVKNIADKLEEDSRGVYKKHAARLRALAKANLKADMADLAAEKKAAEAELVEAVKAKQEVDKVLAKIDAIHHEIGVKQKELDLQKEAVREVYRKATNAHALERARLLGRRAAIETDLSKSADAAAEVKAMLQQAVARVDALKARREGLGAIAESCPDGGQIEMDLADVYKDLEALTVADSLKREIDAILAAIKKEKADRDVLAAIEWAVQRQRERDLSAADGPLLQVMGEFLRAAGRPEVPYIRAATGVCAIGWRRPDGAEIPIQVLSGGEWTLFAAALTTAVILTKEAPVRVLLVEAAEADATTIDQLLAGIAAAAGNLTAAVVMTAHPPQLEGNRGIWTRISL